VLALVNKTLPCGPRAAPSPEIRAGDQGPTRLLIEVSDVAPESGQTCPYVRTLPGRAVSRPGADSGGSWASGSLIAKTIVEAQGGRASRLGRARMTIPQIDRRAILTDEP